MQAFNDTSTTLVWCSQWRDPQHILFQLANTCFCISFLAPNHNHGIVALHALLILGFLLFSAWAWNIICAPDIFSWNFIFLLINIGQVFHMLYQMRPVRLAEEFDQVYAALFQPMHVPKQLFKKLVSGDNAQVVTLPEGESYATQNVTRTDRLSLLVSGRASVLSDNHLLHPIYPKQFLDSPEFEATRVGSEEKFKVSIVAATLCRYIVWQRETLDYLFAKEVYLAHIMSILIARDITTKIYAMNEKIVTDKGSQMDIRLPSITSMLTSCAAATHGSSSGRTLRSSSRCLPPQSPQDNSPDSVFDSHEKLVCDGEVSQSSSQESILVAPNA